MKLHHKFKPGTPQWRLLNGINRFLRIRPDVHIKPTSDAFMGTIYQWSLGGTPVGADSVIRELAASLTVEQEAKLRDLLKQVREHETQARKKEDRLRASARRKLTLAEARACGLRPANRPPRFFW